MTAGVAAFGATGLISWLWWLVHFVVSHCTAPVVNDFRTTASVVVPSYREDPAVLRRCLRTWLAEDPLEVVVVVDEADGECVAMLREATLQDSRVRPVPHRHQGKREALAAGIRAAHGELVVLADSDTEWLPGLLTHVQMPFADPRVAGVGTRQNVYQPQHSVWRRVADWLMDLRYADYVPAMSLVGAVICLSGRTAAYRRDVVLPLLPQLVNERFLGRRCVSGDDGRLTWLVLASGYRTVHQDSARALSMFPDNLRGFAKQRLRWSRNSYRCYLTAIAKGWIWRLPAFSRLTMLQILLTPLTMSIALALVLTSKQARGLIPAAGLAVLLLRILVGRLLRGVSHLRRAPGDWWLLPLVALVVVCISLPVKAFALVTMNRQGWLTREPPASDDDGDGDATGRDVETAISATGSV